MGIKIISESTTEPIGLDEAAENLHASQSTDSPPVWFEAARILKLITAARVTCEEELEQSLVEKTLELALDRFAAEIELPQGPVRSITSVKYIDVDGVEQTVPSDQYVLDTYQRVAWLLPAVDVDWPDTDAVVNAVKVRYVAGYPSTDSPPQTVPEPVRQAMHLLISHWFANRDAVDVALADLPMGVRYLLGKFRRNMGV